MLLTRLAVLLLLLGRLSEATPSTDYSGLDVCKIPINGPDLQCEILQSVTMLATRPGCDVRNYGCCSRSGQEYIDALQFCGSCEKCCAKRNPIPGTMIYDCSYCPNRAACQAIFEEKTHYTPLGSKCWMVKCPDTCTCKPSSTLSLACLNPSGRNCSWYADCLEKHLPCGPEGYALAYATKYCNFFGQIYDKMSPIGKEWIDAVRKCLQLSQVKLIRQNPSANCHEVQENALADHSRCYISKSDPYYGRPSFCDLPSTDVYGMLGIFWVTTEDFGYSWAINEITRVGGHCTIEYLQNCVVSVKCIIVDMVADLLKHTKRTRRSTGHEPPSPKIAAGLVLALSQSLDWEARGIVCIPVSSRYTAAGSSAGQAVVIRLLVMDMQYLLSPDRSRSGSVDMAQEIARLSARVRSGGVSFRGADGGEVYNAGQLVECTGPDCVASIAQLAQEASQKKAAASVVAMETPRLILLAVAAALIAFDRQAACG